MHWMQKKTWLEAALEEGVEIHEPDSLEDYSGQFKFCTDHWQNILREKESA